MTRTRGGHATLVAIALLGSVSPHAAAWQVSLEGSGSGNGEANVAIAVPDGDVIVGGYVDQAATGPAFTVVRLDGVDGAERWRTVLTGITDVPMNGRNDRGGVRALALDPAGDIFAVGASVPVPGQEPLFTAVKLSAASGAIQWRFDGMPGAANDVSVDSAGDAFVAGMSGFYPQNDFTVVNLDETTGAPLWTNQVPNLRAHAIRVLASGDVVVEGTGIAFQSLHLEGARLNGSSGTTEWLTGLQSASAIGGLPGPLAVTPGGDVLIATGRCPDAGRCLPNFVDAYRLSGASGNVVWHRPVPPVQGSSASLWDAVETLDGNLTITVTDIGRCSDSPFYCKHFRTLLIGGVDGETLAEREGAGYLALHDSGDIFVVGDSGSATRLGHTDLHEVWRREPDSVHGAIASFTSNGAVAAGSRLIVPGYRLDGSSNMRSVFSVLSFDASTGTLAACGDGVLDPGETCDDGNLVDGDCCTACTTSAADGTACSDGNACTIGEACRGGTCEPAGPLPCEPCGACEPLSGCHAVVRDTCARSTVTDGATLDVKNRRGRRVRWNLGSGPAIGKADLGDPLGDTGYALCAYGDGRVLVRATAPPGACGNGRVCWRETRHGFEYDDPKVPDGLSHLSLRTGAAGRSRLRVAGRGNALVIGALPVLQRDVTVQLLRTDEPDVCWAADHTTFSVNRSTRLRAVGD